MIKSRIPLISIVGTSKSGKTTFIEKLIPFLKGKGLKIAVIKHHHLDFEIDRVGKDTYRHKKAGSSTVVLSSPRKMALIKDVQKEIPLKDIISRYIDDVDIVITEGYKKEETPKIEIYQHTNRTVPLCFHDKAILAVVADKNIDFDIPQFSLDDVEGVARFINVVLRLGIKNFTY
jgi:molybdopterin-guanine dinucleotide biosynthesis adapter protein